jgi:hypothetical protein
MPTDLGAGPRSARGYDEDEAPTEIGPGRQPGFLDLDEEETEIGRGRMMDDVTELEFVETGAIAILWVKEGHRRGKIFKIKDGTVVGRKDGDLILDDPKVSNPHARFRVEEDKYVLWDFGSKNGTYVNGERIREATVLDENDEIKIGDAVFVLKTLEGDE